MELLKKSPLILDGAMGTMLQRSGLALGERPEALCITNGDAIEGIHKQYIESGSDIIYTNTFGANRRKLAGSGYSSAGIVAAAVRLAKRAAQGGGAKAALSIGPIGELLRPVGELAFSEAYDVFKEMLVAGEEAGADLVVFETMMDLYEVKAGVLAAKENTSLPVFVSMTFEAAGRTFLGCRVDSMACTLEGMGIDAIGINCSLGPAEIFPLAEQLVRCTDLPVLIKANAGLPDPATGEYSVTAEDFGKQMKKYADIGISIMGGCCGTTPDYIREIVRNVKDVQPRGSRAAVSAVCTPSKMVEIRGVRVIGENLNPTGKKDIQRAIAERDMDYLIGKAVAQAEAGADILDVNMGMPGADEALMMEKAVEAVQGSTGLPVQIDSSNPKAIEAGLRICNGKAIVNSVHGTAESMGRILPLVKKYGAAVIGLTIDEKGIPHTAEERIAIAERILGEAQSYGIRREDVLIDCLTLTVSAQQGQAAETLKAVRMVKEKLGLRTVLGVSNVSFGIPNRELMTMSFLQQALAHGLDLPIVNPLVKANMDTIAAFRVLSGEDEGSRAYIERFSAQKEAVPAANRVIEEKAGLREAVIKGLREDAAKIAGELLMGKEALQVINEDVIPALDAVGDDFETGAIFLPQLINSANAACGAFDVIKEHIKATGGKALSKGKIVIATVKGDVHDIGKNIVKVVLENYGYEVIDLGKDVAPEAVVEAVIREGAELVGLSALMTTTLESMKTTIVKLKESGHSCKTVVGGAVLTPAYAAEIGADYYSKDAKAAVDIAKEVFGDGQGLAAR
ncbi:MAG: homocysteine S-methyltransferase family protein [Clostridiales bacterium]|nr:homocysteine S-methyltransferase family protein [Clostridiales bacterium]